MNCESCLKEFESKRNTAKFCSDKCRKLAFLGVSVPSVPPKEEVSVLKSTKTTGVCHGCNVKQPSPLVCICHLCIANKVTHESLGLKMCEVIETPLELSKS